MLTGSAATLRVRRESGIKTDVWVSGVCGKKFRSISPSRTNNARLDHGGDKLAPRQIERKLYEKT